MTDSTISFSKQELKPFLEGINRKADTVIQYFLAGYFVFGLFLAFFYDTWLIALSVGGLCLIAYYLTKYILPEYSLYQYVASAILAIFMAQFIYQMHGMFEMHFFAFIGAILLIIYQQWKLQIPLILIVVIHHSSFAYLQYTGSEEIYFTQSENMSLQTFLFHALLTAVIVTICGGWAYNLRKATLINANNTLLLKQQLGNIQISMSFAEAISKGELDKDYTFAGDDQLGQSLLQMRNSLIKARQKEEEDRFINVGVAEISEILRNSAGSIQELSVTLISKLVKYMGVNQGGLFIMENVQEPELVLTGCYAYERVKHLKKSITAGQGLLGQMMLEKETIYMTELPESYIQITSGLGKASPRSILIVPIKTSEEMVGAIEIASFEQIPAYRISFLEKVCESIATTIRSARITQQTSQLLDEVQVINEQMRSQEEEMKQNMEELIATQEELERKVSEYEDKIQEKDMLIQQLENKGVILN